MFSIWASISFDDAFAEVSTENYVVAERSAMPESDQDLMTVSLKIDKEQRWV